MEKTQKIAFLRLIPETFRFIWNNLAANALYFAACIVFYGFNLVLFFQIMQMEMASTYASQTLEELELAKIFGVQFLALLGFAIVATGFIGYLSNAARGVKWSLKKTLSESIKGFWRPIFSSLFISNLFGTILLIAILISTVFMFIPTVGPIIMMIALIAAYLAMIFFGVSYLPIYFIEVVHKKNIIDSIKRTGRMLKGHLLRLAGTVMLFGLISALLTIPIIIVTMTSTTMVDLYSTKMIGALGGITLLSMFLTFFMYNYMIVAHCRLDERITVLESPEEYAELA